MSRELSEGNNKDFTVDLTSKVVRRKCRQRKTWVRDNGGSTPIGVCETLTTGIVMDRRCWVDLSDDLYRSDDFLDALGLLGNFVSLHIFLSSESGT